MGLLLILAALVAALSSFGFWMIAPWTRRRAFWETVSAVFIGLATFLFLTGMLWVQS